MAHRSAALENLRKLSTTHHDATRPPSPNPKPLFKTRADHQLTSSRALIYPVLKSRPLSAFPPDTLLDET